MIVVGNCLTMCMICCSPFPRSICTNDKELRQDVASIHHNWSGTDLTSTSNVLGEVNDSNSSSLIGHVYNPSQCSKSSAGMAQSSKRISFKFRRAEQSRQGITTSGRFIANKASMLDHVEKRTPDGDSHRRIRDTRFVT